MKTTHLAFAATLFATLGFHKLAHASDPAGCTLDETPIVVTYWNPPEPYDHHDERCDLHGACKLQGWLSRPATGSNLPAIILLHGSGDLGDDTQRAGGFCNVINYFTSHGYVVFQPFRRGVRDVSSTSYAGSGFQNTGFALADWVQSKTDGTTDDTVYWTTEYMQDEAADLQDAITTLVGRHRDNGNALVDPTRIAIMGHSYGGAIAAFAAEINYSPRPRAAVSLSGAGMSWHGSPVWASALDGALRFHLIPTYFQRVLNEDAHTPNDNESAISQNNAALQNGAVASYATTYSSITPSASYKAALCTPNAYPNYHCVHASFVQESQFVNQWIGTLKFWLSSQGM